MLVAELRPRSTSGSRSPNVLLSSATMQASAAVAAVAPVEADRVEDVAEHAQLGEHQDALDRRVAGEARRTACFSGAAPVEVVAVAERDDVAPVDGEEPQPPLELGQLVEVEQPVRDRVAEDVPRRRPPRVHSVPV